MRNTDVRHRVVLISTVSAVSVPAVSAASVPVVTVSAVSVSAVTVPAVSAVTVSAVAAVVVRVVPAGARYAVEAPGTHSGSDVVGDVVDVDLTDVVAIGRHDAVVAVVKRTKTKYNYNF